jgi:hypothetical protein
MSVVTAMGTATDVKQRRELCFEAIRAQLSADELASAVSCAMRLLNEFPSGRSVSENVVLVAYGGGKDSSYTVTFVRFMQLIIDRLYGTTFSIRTVTNWVPGMTSAVLENIDRAYQALALYDDPSCEVLLVTGNTLAPFSNGPVRAPETAQRVRLDMLMTGHRTGGDARPTFCNTCNMRMINAFALAARHGQGVDVIITGDSSDEQRSYLRWVALVARRVGAAKPRSGPGEFANFMSTVNRIGETYYTDIYGERAPVEVQERTVAKDVPSRVRFFSIYGDTEYASGEHWDLLTKFLGFQFDDIAFSFTESDCGNPALMAHIRGLKCQHIYGRSYAEGIKEYVDFAISLMRDKRFPDFLIEKVRARYDTPEAIGRMRQVMDRYSWETFGVGEEQLLCMLYAPFGDKAAFLPRYLTEVHPELACRPAEIIELLAGQTQGTPADPGYAGLRQALERISGLELRYLRQLYTSPVRRTESGGASPGVDIIGAILEGDPHKAIIKSQHSPTGPVVEEQISGR